MNPLEGDEVLQQLEKDIRRILEDNSRFLARIKDDDFDAAEDGVEDDG